MKLKNIKNKKGISCTLPRNYSLDQNLTSYEKTNIFMCYNKIRFNDEHSVSLYIKGWIKENPTAYLIDKVLNKHLRSYHCPICDGYHTTTRPVKEKYFN